MHSCLKVSKYRGFTAISSIPALIPSNLKVSYTCPVVPMIEGYLSIGIFLKFKKSFIIFVAVIPCIIGILKSIKILCWGIEPHSPFCDSSESLQAVGTELSISG